MQKKQDKKSGGSGAGSDLLKVGLGALIGAAIVYVGSKLAKDQDKASAKSGKDEEFKKDS